jgi:hypothetical protein
VDACKAIGTSDILDFPFAHLQTRGVKVRRPRHRGRDGPVHLGALGQFAKQRSAATQGFVVGVRRDDKNRGHR